MKHLYCSAIIFVLLLSGCMWAHSYTKGVINRLSRLACQYCDVCEDETIDPDSATKMEEIISDSETALGFFVNKEHLAELKKNIDLLEYSAENKKGAEVRTKSIEVLNTLDRIEKYLIALN